MFWICKFGGMLMGERKTAEYGIMDTRKMVVYWSNYYGISIDSYLARQSVEAN
jgi:hypothetical protein